MAITLDLTIAWVASLLLTHFVSFAFFSSRTSASGGDVAKYAAVLANQLCNFASVLVLTGLGLQCWCFSTWHDPANSGTAQQRLHSEAPVFHQAEYIVKISLAFQIYDVLAGIIHPGVRNWIVMVNRLGTAYVCIVCLQPAGRLLSSEGEERSPYAYFYAAFFLGLSEATVIPLTVYNSLMYLQKEVQKSQALMTVQEICKVLALLLFIYIRCYWWPFEIAKMWSDCMELEVEYRWYEKYNVMDPRSQNSLSLVLLGLDILQIFWGVKVCQIIYAIAKGDPKTKKESDKMKKTS